MSLRLKFNLILIVIFLISLAGAAAYYNGYLEKSAINDVRNNSTVLMETALAIRSYTTEEIQPKRCAVFVTNFRRMSTRKRC